MMMKKLRASYYILVLCALFGCGKDAANVRRFENTGNNPYHPDTIMVTYGTNPKRALQLLDSAVILGTIDDFNEKLIRATIYSRSLSEQHQDSALAICEGLLQHDSVVNDIGNREIILDMLMHINRIKTDDNEYLRWASQKADLCRERGNEVELLRTEAEIGTVMTHIGSVEEGLEKISNSIQQLNKPGSVKRMDAFIVACKRKMFVLVELCRFAEVVPVAQMVNARLDHYLQNEKEYAEDCYRLKLSGNPQERDRYIDFCRAQANGFLAIGYAKSGDEKNGHKYLKLFEQSDYARSFSARRMIIQAQMALGMYDEVLSTSQEMLEQMGTDTINQNYAMILGMKARIANARGESGEAFALMSRYALLSRELSDSLHKSHANEFAVRYKVKEQQLKLQKAESESREKTTIAIAFALLLVVTLIAMFHFWRQQQVIKKKNQALVLMINEGRYINVEDNDEEYENEEVEERKENIIEVERAEKAEAQVETETDSQNESEEVEKADNDDKGAESDALKPKKTAVSNSKDAALFASIDAAIRNERLYSNVYLQRQDICERFGISRITLNNLLSQFRNNPSLPQYINSIRMEEALKLLRDCPNMSITDIAENVGFSMANFRIQFIRHFGMTPLEFRKSL